MRLLVLTTALTVFLAGCGLGAGANEQVVVSAASSLGDVFEEIEAVFEQEHPGIDVVLNLGGSSSLREQIIVGAPADVFASADPEIMDEVVEAGLVEGEARVFALNRMQITVPVGNPSGVSSLEDLVDGSLLVGLCAAEVPCGEYARTVLAKAGLEPRVDSEEPNVRALLVKLEAGELDAGITYVTDTVSSRALEGVRIPEELNVSARYAIAVLNTGSSPVAASKFVTFVLSDRGLEILTDHGFTSP